VALSASQLRPASFEEAAKALAEAAAVGRSVRILGAGTKLGWGIPGPEPDIELWTTALDQVVEHNVGDLTAVLQAGVPVARAQETFAAAGQMLALDPPLGRGEEREATVGGMLATGDSGPRRHRYGAPRDLVLGMTVALSDGTIARSGGNVIKNVAGYDLGKLFCGSFGTLGVILQVSVRLHPLPADKMTAVGESDDPDVLAAAGRELSKAPLELEALDVAWERGHGRILAQVGGTEVAPRAQRINEMMRTADLGGLDATTDDDRLWDRQRAGQRASEGKALVRVGARPSVLANVLRAAEAVGGTVVGRVALGTSYVSLDPDSVGRFRAALPGGTAAVLLDAPARLRQAADPWSAAETPALELMRRVKLRFDPARVCNPGLFVGGI